MSYLYVTEQGSTIGISDNRFQVKYKDGLIKSVPIETLEIIEIFGNVQITTQCLEMCLRKGINIIFYSTKGSYYGRLISTSHVNVQRQRLQADIGKNEIFKLAFSKRIIDAKIRNQIVIIRRYARNKEVNIERSIDEMQYMLQKIKNKCSTIEQLMGYEGAAAKIYFKVIGKLINPEFAFDGRNRRPPLDPFNSMLSLGYSIMLNEIYGKIEGKGLNPYFGIMHRDKEKHPTLASDLMEEWRAVLIDSTVLSMLNGHELDKEDFNTNLEQPGVFLAKEGFKTYIKKLETKFRTESKYLSYVEYSVSFRRALDLQVNQLVKAMESDEPELYRPIIIR